MKQLLAVLAFLLFIGCASCAQAADRPKDNGFSVLEGGAELRWSPDVVPLTIFVHPSAAMWFYHVQKAADVWNQKVGFQLFQVSESLHPEAVAFLDSSPGIIPLMGYPPNSACDDSLKRPGLPMDACNPYTSMKGVLLSGMMVSASVWMPMDVSAAVMPDAYLLLVHELGHVLGLGHDETLPGQKPWSIMEPALNLVEVLGKEPSITDEDAQRVIDWYLLRKGVDEWLKAMIPTSSTSG